ncbi:MAG: hypothetical protein AB9M60_04880, partial [Leptothrix sp. (in: b-proteobacteria)]
DALPVIMVTGQVLHDHRADAARLGYHVLLKPVAPNRLRAMVTHKLGVAEPDGAPPAAARTPGQPEPPHTIEAPKTGT